MKHDENFIEFLMKHYKVSVNQDSSYTVETSSGTYHITKESKPSNMLTEYGVSRQEGSFDKIPIFQKGDRKHTIGRDDLRPDFDGKIKRKHKIKGMLSDPDEIPRLGGDSDSSSETNPLINISPPFPSKGKHKKFPEPDPDHYNPNGFDI